MKYLICNFKNKLEREDVIKYNLNLGSLQSSKCKVVLCPAFPYLDIFDANGYSIGAQNISSFQDKTITGEITGEQLKSLGCKFVIVGHSERRHYLREINIDFINKISNAISNKIRPIYCIGETLQEKEEGKTKEVLEKQISEVLNNVEIKDIIIAYEPVWAIGTGLVPNNDEIKDIVSYIKSIIFEKYETRLNVLYGGSVNPDNLTELIKISNVDGFLVGGSSLDPNNVKIMSQIIENS